MSTPGSSRFTAPSGVVRRHRRGTQEELVVPLAGAARPEPG